MMQAAEYGISLQPGIRQADCVGARWREPAPTSAQADLGLTPLRPPPVIVDRPIPHRHLQMAFALRESKSRDTPDEGSRPAARIPSSPAVLVSVSTELVHPGAPDL